MLTLVAWNIENLMKRLGELPAAAHALGDPDVLCLQEIRVRAQDAADVAAVERALPGYRCFLSLSRDPYNVNAVNGTSKAPSRALPRCGARRATTLRPRSR